MTPTEDRPTSRDLPPAFNAGVKKVLAYRPQKSDKGRSRDRRVPATPD